MICSVFKPSRKKNGKRIRQRLYWGQYRLDGHIKVNRIPLKTPDKQVAEERLRKLIVDTQKVSDGISPSVAIREAQEKTLDAHVDDYTGDMTARGRDVMYTYNIEHRLSRLFKECGWKFLKDITAAKFVEWRSAQSDKASKTLNEYYDAASGFLAWMHRHGKIGSNPLSMVGKVETRGREVRVRRAYNEDELLRLLAAVPVERQALYLVAVCTGLRKGELEALVWGDVCLDGDTPHICARASTTKNHKSAVIGLHPDAAQALLGIRPANIDGGSSVFPKLPRSEQFQEDLKKAEIPPLDSQGRRVDFHALRHTLATRLAVAGVQPRIAMELMRHSDMRLTQKIYTDASLLPTFAAVGSLPSLVKREVGSYAQLHAQNAQIDAQNPVLSGLGQSQPVALESALAAVDLVDNNGVLHAESQGVASGQEKGIGCRTRIRT